MPIIAAKTVVGLTFVATTVVGGVAGDVHETVGLASKYAGAKIELAMKSIAADEFSDSDVAYYKYSHKGLTP